MIARLYEGLGWLALAVAILAALQAARILLFRRPAKARLLHNGYRKQKAMFDACWVRGHPPTMPARVTDRIAFEDGNGETVRIDVRRPAAPHDDDLLIWHDPRRPERVSVTGPHVWLAGALGAFISFLWAGW